MTDMRQHHDAPDIANDICTVVIVAAFVWMVTNLLPQLIEWVSVMK